MPKKMLKVSKFVVLLSSAFITGLLSAFLFMLLSDKPQIQTESQEIAQKCAGNISKEQCYSKEFEVLTQKTDYKFSYDTLQSLQNIDVEARGCHLIAHIITQTETRKDPSKWQKIATAFNPNDCSGGFMHGAIEQHLLANPTAKFNAQNIHEVCDAITNPEQGEQNCFHIMGHLVLTSEGGKIPEAIPICDQIEKGDNQLECYSGIFMENITRVNLVSHGIAAPLPWDGKTQAEVENLCRAYDGEAAHGCWKEIAHLYVAFFKDDAKKIFERCNSANNSLFASECAMHAVGIITTDTKYDPNIMVANCQTNSKVSGFEDRCILETVSSMIASSQANTSNAMQFCNLEKDSLKNACFERVGLSLAFDENKRQQVCQTVPANYQSACIGKFPTN